MRRASRRRAMLSARSGKPSRSEGGPRRRSRKLLASPSLAGHVLPEGEPLRDRDGLIVRIDPLIPPEDYERLQTALRTGRTVGGSMPRDCYKWRSAPSVRPSCTPRSAKSKPLAASFRYYLCRECRRRNCLAGDGYRPGTSKTWPPGCSSAGRHAGDPGARTHRRPRIPAPNWRPSTRRCEHLEEQYVAGAVYRGETGAERFAAMMTRLEERRDRLSAQPATPARIEYRPTGRTFANRWEEEDAAGRRQLMVNAGFQVRIARTSIPPSDIAAEARRQGITASARQLRNRAANIRYMATKNVQAGASGRAEGRAGRGRIYASSPS